MSATIFKPANHYITKSELIATMRVLPDGALVCISGFGPVLEILSEPGASEPFCLLSGCGHDRSISYEPSRLVKAVFWIWAVSLLILFSQPLWHLL